MPMYDGYSLLTEKQAIVLDLGTKYTKFGFAGEASPRCIVRSEVKCPKTGQVREVMNYTDKDDLYGLLVDFLHMLFFKHVQLSPKERRLVVVESLLCPTIVRDTLAKVLFQHFEVCSLLYVPSHLVCLATLAVDTGLVLDVGHQEALLVPVYEGVPVLRIWQAQPLAGAAIEQRLRNSLVEWYSNQDSLGDSIRKSQEASNLSESIIEDIKVRGSFVTKQERGIVYWDGKEPSPPIPDLTYPIDGDRTISIPGPVREACHEVLFERDNDQMSLPNMILDAILKSAVDMRRPLAENIVLVGGSVMVPGFKARLLAELQLLLESPQYKDQLNINTFKFHNPPGKENYIAWLGGALYGATDMITMRSLTRESYSTLNSVPDWCSLLHNRLDHSGLSICVNTIHVY
ncbi:actin-related protein 10 isoform X2 [Homalodisca vitripennis]|uniref:actin-related protein 10 isoform X2 n=1 Tax=Homalodisca vitripennis TaxID=197043 RepID=UPI001EEA378B|nr:actin-related protein 10 isoform X2 [Homalodisca vitripennis]